MPDQSSQEQYEKGKLYEIDIKKLKSNPFQPRKFFDEGALKTLAESIKEKGLLEPILFQKDDSGDLIIVAGERRWRASKKAKLEKIPAICIEGNKAEIALIENLLRQDLTVVEEAESIQRMMDEHGYNQKQVAEMLGKSEPTMSDIALVARLPEQIRSECREDPKCSRRVLLKIGRSGKKEKGMISLFRKMKEKGELAGEVNRKSRGSRTLAPKDYLSTVNSLIRQLSSLDMSEWSEDERSALKEKLEDLKHRIDEKVGSSKS